MSWNKDKIVAIGFSRDLIGDVSGSDYGNIGLIDRAIGKSIVPSNNCPVPYTPNVMDYALDGFDDTFWECVTTSTESYFNINLLAKYPITMFGIVLSQPIVPQIQMFTSIDNINWVDRGVLALSQVASQIIVLPNLLDYQFFRFKIATAGTFRFHRIMLIQPTDNKGAFTLESRTFRHVGGKIIKKLHVVDKVDRHHDELQFREDILQLNRGLKLPKKVVDITKIRPIGVGDKNAIVLMPNKPRVEHLASTIDTLEYIPEVPIGIPYKFMLLETVPVNESYIMPDSLMLKNKEWAIDVGVLSLQGNSTNIEVSQSEAKLEYTPSSEVLFKVIDEDGVPLTNASISITNRYMVNKLYQTNAVGSVLALIQNVCDNFITVSYPEHYTLLETLVIPYDVEVVDTTFTLYKVRYSVEFAVTDNSGNPLEGIYVTADRVGDVNE